MHSLRERFAFRTRMHNLQDLPLASRAAWISRRKWKSDYLLGEVVTRGTAPMLASLLARGADPNAANEYGETPLFYAAMYQRPLQVSLLLRYKADPNRAENDGYTPLMHDGPTAITRRLLFHGADPRARAWDGRTALHGAAQGGTRESVRLLLDFGADPDARADDGTTPLLEAAIVGDGNQAVRISIAALLLSRGADLRARGADGRTPLLWAAHRGYPDMVAFLLSRGANPHDRDDNGRTALEAAQHRGYWYREQTLDVLRGAGQ